MKENENERFRFYPNSQEKRLFDWLTEIDEYSEAFEQTVHTIGNVILHTGKITRANALDIEGSSEVLLNAVDQALWDNFTEAATPFEQKMALAHDIMKRDESLRMDIYADVSGKEPDEPIYSDESLKDFTVCHTVGLEEFDDPETLEQIYETVRYMHGIYTRAELRIFLGDLFLESS